MEKLKIAQFYAIIKAHKGRIYKRSGENELYREKRVYSFLTELAEYWDSIWLTIDKLFYKFILPVRTLETSLERLVAKVAFCPPSDTYAFNFDLSGESTADRKLADENKYGEILLAQYCTLTKKSIIDSYPKMEKMMKHIECFYTFNKYGNRIACLLIKCSSHSSTEKPQKTIVFSHSNAEDIGSMLFLLWRYRKKLGVNVFVYDYSGYGMSSGCASERNIYADVEAAVEELCRRKRFRPSDIILMGESIGSVPTVHMATKMSVQGVILQSSFMSGLRIYLPYDGPTLLFDPFPNIELVPRIKSKTLVIHGTEDLLVDISHAVSIYRALPNPVMPFWANGFFHMNIHKHQHYFDRLKCFIEQEL